MLTIMGSPCYPGTSGPTSAETSDPGSQNEIIIEGTFLRMGIECPVFQLASGQQITLSGSVPPLNPEEVVRLKGKWARASTCMQGATFHVSNRYEDK